MNQQSLIAAAVFGLTYVVLGFGALPPLRLDRAGAALVGATAMVIFRVLTPGQAVGAIDFQTIALLFGMMVVVAHLRIAGFFIWLGNRVLRWGHTPGTLLVAVVMVSGVLSALFVNDTACILLTPLVLETVLSLSLPPVPYLLAVAMGANAGSVGTLVGNPQNMLVGSFSGISYARFLVALGPVAILSLAATALFLRLFYGRALVHHGVAGSRGRLERPLGHGGRVPAPSRANASRSFHPFLMGKALVITGLLLIALLAGVNPGVAALSAASLLLLTRRIRPARVYAHIDWALLVMFAGLFVVVRGIETAGLTDAVLSRVPAALRHSNLALAGITTLVSNVVSNVPAVLVLRGWPATSIRPDRAWCVLAMASTLAGNFTIVGSVANLIVVEQARGRACIGFWEYVRVGAPLTLITLVLGLAWLAVAGPVLVR